MSLRPDNDFWRFSLAVYAAPGVAGECLALQEAHGIDVNLLLFCAWLGAARRIALSAGEIERVRQLVQAWHDDAVRPLRAVRQKLKGRFGPDGEAFRTRVKGVELDAEQWEQAMLFAHAGEAWPQTGTGVPRDSLTANVALFLAKLDRAAPPQNLIAAALKVADGR